MSSRITQLGCEVVAILSDHGLRKIDVLASEMSGVDVGELQAQLDLMVADRTVAQHWVRDCCFYGLSGDRFQ